MKADQRGKRAGCLDFNQLNNFLIDHVVMQHDAGLSTGLTTVNVVNREGVFSQANRFQAKGFFT